LESKVLFSLGKSELTPEGQRAIRRVANAIKSDFPGKYIRIEGHTDSMPIKSVPGKTNLELSNERAVAVWRYLVDQCGLDPKRLYTAGFGQYRPVASNRTERGRQMNRRVEIVVVDE
jgi:chemotaxis protein MotB